MPVCRIELCVQAKMARQQAAIEPDGAWAEACCTAFADASDGSHYVGEMQVAAGGRAYRCEQMLLHTSIKAVLLDSQP